MSLIRLLLIVSAEAKVCLPHSLRNLTLRLTLRSTPRLTTRPMLRPLLYSAPHLALRSTPRSTSHHDATSTVVFSATFGATPRTTIDDTSTAEFRAMSGPTFTALVSHHLQHHIRHYIRNRVRHHSSPYLVQGVRKSRLCIQFLLYISCLRGRLCAALPRHAFFLRCNLENGTGSRHFMTDGTAVLLCKNISSINQSIKNEKTRSSV